MKSGLLILSFLLALFKLGFVPLVEPYTIIIEPLNTPNALATGLNFSTYLGENSYDEGFDIAVATDGCCYVTGATESADFPSLITYDNNVSGFVDAFAAKFSESGSLLWSTYLGGNGEDRGNCIAVANDGSCYLSGKTYSSNFPTLNAYDSTLDGVYDAFVVKFSTSGVLQWGTYLGGATWDNGRGIVVAPNSNCYVTGFTSSINFPTLNAYDDTFNGGAYDVFVLKLSNDGSLLWSTYLGGDDYDRGYDIDISTDDCCYVVGYTESSNFPTLNASDNILNGADDAFIVKFYMNGSLLWSTFLGGDSFDQSYGVAFSSENSLFVTGFTFSNNFPTLNAYDSTFNGYYDVFITKFIDFNIIAPPDTPTPHTEISLQIYATSILAYIITMPIFLFLLRKRKK